MESAIARRALTLDTENLQMVLDDMNSALEECRKDVEELSVTKEQLAKMEYEDVDRFATSINKSLETAEDFRKDFKRAYQAPMNAIEKAYKAELEPVRELRDAYFEERNARRKAIVDDRKAELRQAYDEFLEANGTQKLSELLDFEQVIEGIKVGYSKGWSSKKAIYELEDKLGSILAGWNSVRNATWHFPEIAERTYIKTLSLQAVMDGDEKLHRMEEDFKELHEEISENEAFVDEPREWVIHVSMTEAQKEWLVGCMRSRGISGTIREVK